MNYSYITFLGSDDYLVGTLALVRSLSNVNSKYPLTVMVSNKVSKSSIDILRRYKLKYINVDNVRLSRKVIISNKTVKQAQWDNTFGKLYVFGMTEFSKLVFLDSDLFVRENIDELFTKDNLSAVFAGKSYPGNELWQKSLNSGVMVIVPKKGEDKRLFALMKENISQKNIAGIGDQDIIHKGYPNWADKPNLELGEEYNVFSLYEPYYLSNVLNNSSIKILHFIGNQKPWNMSFLQKQFYLTKRIVKQFTITKSFKGDLSTIKDFNSYYKLCNSIKREIHLDD